MNPSSNSSSGGREPKAGASVDTKGKKVPNTDMQADDAGTSDSGVTRSASKVDAATKQTGKAGKDRQ